MNFLYYIYDLIIRFLFPYKQKVELESEKTSFDNNMSGTKRALLVGINYIGSENELKGCINDTQHVSELLTNHLGYSASNIVILRDKAKKRSLIPTRSNILNQLKSFIEKTKSGDTFFFGYSGHGGQLNSEDRDEIDGRDETLVPLDWISRVRRECAGSVQIVRGDDEH